MPDGHATLTADTLLKMRSEVDVCMAGGGDDDDDDDDHDHEEFDYQSDQDKIILSNWDRKRGIDMARGNNYKNDRGNEDSNDSSSDEDSSDDSGDSDGCGDNDSGDNGVNNRNSDNEESGNKDRGRSFNGIGRMLEDKARETGMKESITNKNNKKRKGLVHQQNEIETGTCPLRN